MKPNVLLITTDQQHANTIHSGGNSIIQTPNLDKLYANGVLFRRAYTANPVCSPSRATILTGEYPSRHGCWNIGVNLDPGRQFLSDLLRSQGYRTALFGKSHFRPVGTKGEFESPPNIFDRNFWKSWHGPYYGFEHVQLVHGHADEDSAYGMHYGAWLWDQGVDPRKYFGPDGGHREGVWNIPEDLHYTRWTADQTISFLHSDDTKPFFVWCSFQDPHNAFLCPEPWGTQYDPNDMSFNRRQNEMYDKTRLHRHLWDGTMHELGLNFLADPDHETAGVQCLGLTSQNVPYNRERQWLASYYGMISLVDFHLGRIMQTLADTGKLDNTIVIFSTDHGDYAGNHGLWLKGPIHYEDVIKVPFIVSWPGHTPKAQESQSLMSHVDLAPTLLEACGFHIPASMQGISQLHTWLNPQTLQRDWCLVENRAESDLYVKTLVTPQFKLNYYLQWDEGELYDLGKDPLEFNNLYNNPDYTHVKISLLQKLISVSSEIEGPWAPRNSFA